MTVALRGNLRDFGIGEVFQLIGQQRKSGVLEIDGKDNRIRVTFSDGSVISAATAGPSEHAALGDMLVRTGLLTAENLVVVEREYETAKQGFQHLLIQHSDLSAQEITEVEDLVTHETIFTLLRWSSGSFHFRPQPITHNRDPARCLPAEQILMDGLRMVDEWRALDAEATDDATVFQRIGRFETYREHVPGDSAGSLEATERLLLAVDGRKTLRQLVDESRLGTFEGARRLSGLRDAGIIEPLDPDSLPRERRRARGAAGLAGRVRSAVFGLAAFGTLAAMVVMLQMGPETSSSAPVPRIQDPLRAARIDFDTRRMRNLVEAYHFATGEWPADLGALVDRGWIRPDALAVGGVGPYYYARRETGAFVLAPER